MESSAALLMVFLSFLAFAASPGDKRTILTSGEKVQTIHYQLGQGTVLYFGMKPKTVIGGNNNYFHIEKFEDGLTIQPLSNFSTNLTVLDHEKRFLFFLTPAKGGQVDTFIDVRWVPENESRPVATVKSPKEAVRDLGQKVRLSALEVRLKREIRIDSAKRSILEFEVQSNLNAPIKTGEIEVLAVRAGRPISHQVSLFEQDELKPKATVLGRLIVTGSDLRGASIVTNYRGQSGKIQIKGGIH